MMYAARLKQERERERERLQINSDLLDLSKLVFTSGETRNKGSLLKEPMFECLCNVPDGRFQRKDAHISEMQIFLPEGEGLVIGR